MTQTKLLIAPIFAFALTACLSDNDNSSKKAPDYGEKSSGATYKVDGSTFITTNLQDTNFYCNGSTLVSDINETETDTIIFSVSGNTLTGSGELDTLDSEAVIRPTSSFTRVGSGKGLEGAWRFKEFSYTVVSGTLSANEKATNEAAARNYNRQEESISNTLEFQNGAITTYSDGKTADDFIRMWNKGNDIVYDDTTLLGLADSSLYDITLKAVDKNTVELSGDKTKEKVTLKISPNGDLTYKSDKAGHAEYKFLDDAKTCPNLDEPEWFTEFKTENRSAMAALVKLGKSQVKRGYSYKTRIFPARTLGPL